MRSAGSPGARRSPAPWRSRAMPAHRRGRLHQQRVDGARPEPGPVDAQAQRLRGDLGGGRAGARSGAASRGALSGPRPGHAASREHGGRDQVRLLAPVGRGPPRRERGQAAGGLRARLGPQGDAQVGLVGGEGGQRAALLGPDADDGRSASTPSSGIAGKLAGPTSSQTTSPAAPAAAACAAFSAIVPPPRVTTASAPLHPARALGGAVVAPARRRSRARPAPAAARPAAPAPSGSLPISGSGPSRAAAGPS